MTDTDATTHVRHLVVEGRVQGVGYRWFARERARRLALSGWVKNRADGCVEITVSGPARAIDQFVSDLGVGPQGAMVQAVRESNTVAPAAIDDASERGQLPFPFVIQR